jgi:hypothetical protein
MFLLRAASRTRTEMSPTGGAEMKLTAYSALAPVVDRARHTIAPTGAPVRGGAVSIDGFTRTGDSALTEVLMV